MPPETPAPLTGGAGSWCCPIADLLRSRWVPVPGPPPPPGLVQLSFLQVLVQVLLQQPSLTRGSGTAMLDRSWPSCWSLEHV